MADVVDLSAARVRRASRASRDALAVGTLATMRACSDAASGRWRDAGECLVIGAGALVIGASLRVSVASSRVALAADRLVRDLRGGRHG